MTNCCFRTGENKCHAGKKKAPARKKAPPKKKAPAKKKAAAAPARTSARAVEPARIPARSCSIVLAASTSFYHRTLRSYPASTTSGDHAARPSQLDHAPCGPGQHPLGNLYNRIRVLLLR